MKRKPGAKRQLRQARKIHMARVRAAKNQHSDRANQQPRELQGLSNNEVEMMEQAPVEEDEDEEDDSIVPIRCIICCCPALKNKKYPTRVKFLLGQVVPYSLLCDSTFRQEEIEQYIDLCSSCVRLLGQGEQLHGTIIKLERDLDQVKNNVKKLVQNSTLIKQEDGGNLVVEKIYGNIREQLLSDFVGEENFIVADWSGVEFHENEEHISRPEMENDPLEFGEDSIVDEVITNSPIADADSSSVNLEFGEDSGVEIIANKLPAADSSIANSKSEFQKLHKDKVVATYSKTTPKRSVAPIKISPLMKQKHKEKKKYVPRPAIENVSKIQAVILSSLQKTGIFARHLNRGNSNLSEPMVSEIRKLPDLTSPARKGHYPCAICPDKFDTLVEASLHRKFIHPGLTLCASPVVSLQCGKIFRSRDIKRHRIESHPLLRCPECTESFTTTDRLESHLKAAHHQDGSALPPLPELGYDVKLIPWVIPMTKDEIQEAARDQGFFRVNLTRIEIKDTSPEQVVEEQSGDIGENVDEALPSGLVSQTTNESNNEQEILKSRTDSGPKNISTTPNANVFPTELTQPVPVKLKKKKIIYNCGVCNTKFPVQSDLLQHLADAHKQTPKFGCFVCLKEFTSLSECEAHVLSQHPDAKLPEQRVKSKERKISKIPENKFWMWPFICKPCRLRFISLPVLQNHIKSEEHAKMMELGEPVECPRDGCEHKYRGQAELNAHLAEHRKIKCTQCHFKFADPNLLLHHKVRCHKYILTDAETLHPIVHQCRVENCERLFNNKGRLARHMASTHGVGKHKCDQCGRVFSEFAHLNHHVKHGHEKAPGKHMCDICGKRFTKKSNLAAHRPIHGEERPFLCSQCGKAFKTSTSLTLHNYSHDPDRWTKHYPYRILVEKRLQTQRKREAAAAAAAISGGPTTAPKRRRKSNISKGAEIIVDQFISTEEEEGRM
ncbi:zinc finger protein 729 isoform X2 [Folsomia candida]|uniref:zinc finger protein 729 isoform X2 n=1 Tax=Folsomia candida TaxID=158441 RepID=UPI001604DDF7|nr:zinc finger protein 729 isoform X2 [Folsomia candida]